MAHYPWEKSYPPGVKWELDVPKKTIHQIFEESCAQYGDRPFTDFLDKVMTFGDYKKASDRAAAGFQKLGVGPGSVLEWDEKDDVVVVRRAGRYTSENIHAAEFKSGAPRPMSTKEHKEGIRKYTRKRHAGR